MHFQCGSQEIKCEIVINMEVVSLISYQGADKLRLSISHYGYVFLTGSSDILGSQSLSSPFLDIHLIAAANTILKDTFSEAKEANVSTSRGRT